MTMNLDGDTIAPAAPAPMHPEIKARWVAALRSGDYPQGTGALCHTATPDGMDSKSGFCCLGVLGDLYAQDFPERAKWIDLEADGSRKALVINGQADTVYLHVAIVEWAGLDAVNPSVPRDDSDPEDPCPVGCTCGQRISLASVNDRGDSFDEIADLIEAHL